MPYQVCVCVCLQQNAYDSMGNVMGHGFAKKAQVERSYHGKDITRMSSVNCWLLPIDIHAWIKLALLSSQVASKVCPLGSLHSTRSTWGSPAAASVRSSLRLMLGAATASHSGTTIYIKNVCACKQQTS